MSETATVRTAGVGSVVFDADRDVVGHVVMLDLDGVDRDAAVETAYAVDGPAVVCRSSRDGWHVVGLRPRPWSDVLDVVREHSEPEHVDAAEREQRATLRVQPKFDTESGEVVTPSPFVVEVVHGVGPLSGPHLDVLQQRDEPGYLDVLDAEPTVGSTLSTAAYSYEVSR